MPGNQQRKVSALIKCNFSCYKAINKRICIRKGQSVLETLAPVPWSTGSNYPNYEFAGSVLGRVTHNMPFKILCNQQSAGRDI